MATSESVYDTPFAQLYKPSAKYENSANFDPSFRWTYREERAVTRKVDIKILLWILLMFLALVSFAPALLRQRFRPLGPLADRLPSSCPLVRILCV